MGDGRLVRIAALVITNIDGTGFPVLVPGQESIDMEDPAYTVKGTVLKDEDPLFPPGTV